MLVRMGRILVALAALLLGVQSTGVLQFVSADECAPRCAKGEADHEREPACDLCACCTLGRPATLPDRTLVIGTLIGRTVDTVAPVPPSPPDPGKIPHIPISLA